MSISLIKHGVVPVLTLLIAVSSILLQQGSPSYPLLIAAAFFFMISVIFEDTVRALRHLPFVSLGIFHYFSHLNWCMVLYLTLIFFAVERTHRLFPSILFTALSILEYTAIRLSYMPVTTYNILVSLYDFAASIIIVLILRHFQHTRQATKQLQEQTNYLATHDPLTGLLNYEGYMNTVQELVERENNFALIHLDLQDFRTLNKQTVNSGNEILVQLSSTLKKMFKDALLLSRYAGDRFAIALPNREMLLPEIERLMNIKSLGFHVTYSVSQFPQEATTASVLVSLAEDRLFLNKRNGWIVREEVRFQEEKLRMVGELAAGMAHEIRNPLTTIKGFMQLSKKNNYITMPWHDLIMSEITRMSELTAEFLQFSKPHISNMKPEVIQTLIDRVMFLTESEASLRGHMIIKQTFPEELTVLADRDKIVQVLLNIMRNSFEAMEQPGTVHVLLHREAESCLIVIRDTGGGIAEDDLKKIFNPFYTTKENGTGLGLSICKKIIQDHGGSLEARSILGDGSSFSVKLPILNSAAPHSAERQLSYYL